LAIQIDKSLRLPDGEFFDTHEEKSGICVHHTVGGSARSTFNWWMQDRNSRGNQLKVGTAYIIGRDGKVYEVFAPAAWAYQFGLKWSTAKKLKFEKRYIGIELASEGALIEDGGKLYCFDRVSPRTEKARDAAFDCGSDWRGYRYFDRYEEAQLDSLMELIDKLCGDFNIPREAPDEPLSFYGDALARFQGIIGHSMVRADKSDPSPDGSLWDRISTDCGVTPVAIGARTASGGARGSLSDQDLDDLFRHNAETLNKMNVAAGAVVSALLAELERSGRKTYIRLRNPAVGGHTIEYEFVQGERRLVARIAKLLGFERVTDSVLEVRSG
jgi:hypothetical protein